MSDKKQINEEQLEKVSGGFLRDIYTGPDLGTRINPKNYENHINDNVVVIDLSDKRVFALGRLTWAGYISSGCSTMLVFKIQVESMSQEAQSRWKYIVVGSEFTFPYGDTEVYQRA